MKRDLLPVILGPTASGKTSVAVALAHRMGAEIISADSRQVYRGMDIGTGKDLSSYAYNGIRIPYHLIDVAPAGSKYNVFEYQRDFKHVWDDCSQRGVQPILCGGSGLYLESIVRGYRLLPVPQDAALRSRLERLDLPSLKRRLETFKDLHNGTDVDTVKRAARALEIEIYYMTHEAEAADFPCFQSRVFGLDPGRALRRMRISQRLDARLKEGMIEEVQALLDSGIASEDLIYYGLEYKFVSQYILGLLNYAEMRDQLEIAIHQFAKRQMTWFRGMERRGVPITWLPATEPADVLAEKIQTLLAESADFS